MKQFRKLDAAKVHGGTYFLLKSGKLIGGFSHNHILEKLFAVEISGIAQQRKYLQLFQKKDCAVRIVFEEHKRLVVHVLDCVSKPQARAISILQRRANKKLASLKRRRRTLGLPKAA